MMLIEAGPDVKFTFSELGGVPAVTHLLFRARVLIGVALFL